MSDLLTTFEVSKRFLVHPTTLRVWRYRNMGPPFIRVGPRQIRYSPDDIEAWLAKQRIEPEKAKVD